MAALQFLYSQRQLQLPGIRIIINDNLGGKVLSQPLTAPQRRNRCQRPAHGSISLFNLYLSRAAAKWQASEILSYKSLRYSFTSNDY